MVKGDETWVARASIFRDRARGPERERGSSAVEYAIIGALVAAVIVASLAVFGDRVQSLFCTVVDALDLSGVPSSCS